MTNELQTAMAFLERQAQAFSGRATIVGKGPSYAEFDARVAARDRFVIGLNETPLRTACHAAFVIDEDILDQHALALSERGLSAVIVPRLLHRRRNIGGLALYGPPEQPVAHPPWLATLEPRVLRFNLFSAERDAALGETVPGYSFSAPTLAHLLALAGFRDIQLAGVDGGTHYAADFSHVAHKKLQSLQDNFDVQFADLRRVRDRFGVRFSSVRCSIATVFIGAEPEQCLATELLKWSIDSNTFLSVRYADMAHVARDLYVDGQAGTPFSFQRLYLPREASHLGRGVYFDSDMLVMRDVYELFNWDMGPNVLLNCQPTPGRDPQYSVFLVDNQRATWDPDALLQAYRDGRLSYAQIMREFAFVEPRASSLPRQWNSLELLEQGQTANIHFTDMGTQPWLSIYNPNADLWCEVLCRAVQESPAVAQALERSAAQGWVRPSLLWQVRQGHHNPWTLPRSVKRLDHDWLPPHALARASNERRKLEMLRWRLSSRVRRAMQSRTYQRLLLARIALRKIF